MTADPSAAPAGDADPGPPASDLTGLLLDVQRRLEALYALDRQAPVSDFLIPAEEAAAYPGGGSRTLLTQRGDDVSLGVVLDDSVRARLADADPRVQLDGHNLDPFCVVAEEVSHFVYLAFCARACRQVTRLELELQGEVDKYLSSVFLLSLQNEGAVSPRLRQLLFRHYRLAEHLSDEGKERYRTANELAYRYCGYLESRFLRTSRLPDLVRESRRFYRLGQRQKLERIALLE
ncbi:MAG TPA: hypothetical protein VMR21_09480 [Vicinamibacteria bacterium]|nr:hypothetical protein [Vicinamibacteria bacterium]